MKYKIVFLIAVFCIFLAAGCSSSKSDPTADTSVTTEEKTTEAETTNPPVDTAAFFKEIAGGFKADDGNKGFTVLNLSEDGSFNGQYDYMEHRHDEKLGGYFLVKHAKFSGSLQSVNIINEYVYSLSISELDYQTPVGTKEVQGDSHIEYTLSPHIKSDNQFYLLFPNTPLEIIPDDCISFFHNTKHPSNYTDESGKTNTYILYNRNNGNAFIRSSVQNEQSETTVSPTFEATPASAEDLLHSGLWIDYSMQAPDGLFYEFRANDVIVNQMSFANKTVVVNSVSDYPKTLDYSVENNKIYITLENGESKILCPTEEETQMEYSYENSLDPGTYITQRVYHHDKMPSYEVLNAESGEARNASKVTE